jgi:hypothetical protein
MDAQQRINLHKWILKHSKKNVTDSLGKLTDDSILKLVEDIKNGKA